MLFPSGTDPTGNDGVVLDYSNAREVELLVEAALSLPQAIQIFTLNGAKYLGIDKQTGSLAVGNQADFAVICGNPTEQIRDLEKVVWMFKAGVGYDSSKLLDSVRGVVGTR